MGVNVPYSAEFRDTTSNDALLVSLATQTPQGGAAGRMVNLAATLAPADSEESLFRHDLAKATSRQSYWHLVLLAGACLFFFDVLNRRVAISQHDLALVSAWAGRLVPWQKAAVAQPSVVMNRLRESKQSIAQQLDDRRAAVRFEPTPAPVASVPPHETQANLPALELPAAPSPVTPPGSITPEQEEDSYTARLLKAKRRAVDK